MQFYYLIIIKKVLNLLRILSIIKELSISIFNFTIYVN